MWWQTGLALCMISFLALMLYGVRLLRQAEAALKQADSTLRSVQEQVSHTTGESARLLKASAVVMEDLQNKLTAADTWFRAANETGEAVQRVSHSVKVMSQTVENSVLEARRVLHNSQDTVNELMELTTAGIHLWHRVQAYRQSKPKE